MPWTWNARSRRRRDVDDLEFSRIRKQGQQGEQVRCIVVGCIAGGIDGKAHEAGEVAGQLLLRVHGDRRSKIKREIRQPIAKKGC